MQTFVCKQFANCSQTVCKQMFAWCGLGFTLKQSVSNCLLVDTVAIITDRYRNSPSSLLTISFTSMLIK